MWFSALVVLTFALQVINLYLLGVRRKVHLPLMLAVYSGFTVTEAYVAMQSGLQSYWLYVALSVWAVGACLVGMVTK